MRLLIQLSYTFLLLIAVTPLLKAQKPFDEGTLTYQGDTIKRLEKQPGSYFISRLVVYKKQDLVRIETWHINAVNHAYWRKDIQIRNKTGIYSWSESAEDTLLLKLAMDKVPDSVKSEFMARFMNFAMFVPDEEAKRERAERAMQGYPNGYKLDKVIQKMRWFGLPAEKVMLSGGELNEPQEAIITHALDLPVCQAFGSLESLHGTPLQFVVQDAGWQMRLVATKLKVEKLPDSLFQTPPDRKLMSVEDMLQEMRDFK